MMRFNRIPDGTMILLNGENWVVMSYICRMYLLQEFGGARISRIEAGRVERLARWCKQHRMVGASCECSDD